MFGLIVVDVVDFAKEFRFVFGEFELYWMIECIVCVIGVGVEDDCIGGVCVLLVCGVI